MRLEKQGWSLLLTEFQFLDIHTHRQVEFNGVDRFLEGPGEMVPPQRLQQDFLQKLKLIGHPPLSAGVFHRGLWGPQMGHLTDRRHPRTLKALIEQ